MCVSYPFGPLRHDVRARRPEVEVEDDHTVQHHHRHHHHDEHQISSTHKHTLGCFPFFKSQPVVTWFCSPVCIYSLEKQNISNSE